MSPTIITDITAQTTRERELERTETIIDATGDPVYALDASGRFTFVNETFVDLSGYPESTLLGSPVTELMDDEDIETGLSLIESLMQSEERYRGIFEMDAVTANGDRITCENHLALLPYEESFRGTTGVVRDITERQEREQELRRERDRLDEFASVVSHDLRNPLNVASGQLELAKQQCESEHLEDVAHALDRMEDLITDVLTLAREGDEVRERTLVELNDLISQCCRTVDLGARSVQVDSTPTVRADRGRIATIFENLFRNAIEHGGDDVTISVGALTDEPGFYVSDDGVGIDPEDWDRIFESGYSTSPDGTGLGLSIVEQIVDAHDWKVDVIESADGGTRFEITDVDVIEM